MKAFTLEEFLKDPERKVVTRDGKDARILCTDFNNERYPIVGEIQGDENPETYTKDGRFHISGPCDDDLFFAPERHKGWVNIFNVDGCNHLDHKIYESKDDAVKEGKCWSFYVATVKIEWEE